MVHVFHAVSAETDATVCFRSVPPGLFNEFIERSHGIEFGFRPTLSAPQNLEQVDIVRGLIQGEMRGHPLRALLSRMIRGPEDGSQVELVYRHRGAPLDELKIPVASISRIGKGWFMLDDGETQIPYHRVLVVRNLRSGQVLWKKRS